MIRTLVMTALAALPMKACSGARQTSAERPTDSVSVTEGGGASDAGKWVAGEPSPGDAGVEPDAGEPAVPDGSGRVWRGGDEADAGAGSADVRVAREDEDGSGRVWRGAPGEDRYEEERDASEPEDARRRRDYVVPPPVAEYGVPITDYGIPEPIIRPMYAVEPPEAITMYGVEPVPEYMAPLPDPITFYGAPVPPPVAAYAVPAPDDDDDDLGPVLRYGVPDPR
ncbi:MAG: hypothetical protein JXB32_09350 [Deltaproteobacteria bacterium]|nr:hypothetical protein [Deltaproteobacteria bacterium]